MDYLEFVTNHARREASNILGTDRAVVTKKIYPARPHVFVLSLDCVGSIMHGLEDDADADWLFHHLGDFEGVGYCEGCDTTWPLKRFTMDEDAERCDLCIEAMPTPEEIAADKGDIECHRRRDED